MWQTEMVTIVRYLIQDYDPSNYTYSDDRLVTAITVGATLVKSDVSLVNTYTISIDGESIDPDPTDPRDDGFIALVCLKTALFILANTLKTQSMSSIKVVDGPSTIDMSNSTAGVKTLYEDMMKMYEQAKLEYQSGTGSVGQAVLTPYSSPGISFGSYHYYDCPR